jgi:hypothetical protein
VNDVEAETMIDPQPHPSVVQVHAIDCGESGKENNDRAILLQDVAGMLPCGHGWGIQLSAQVRLGLTVEGDLTRWPHR